jgi:hypothetical protein
MSPSLYPAHCRERSAESCCSSHATPASPSGRTGFSSRGSRHVLECSSAHWGPCRPSRVPGMTPAAGLAQRIGDSTSLRRLYLSNMLFRPECSSSGEPHRPFTRQVGGNADRHRPQQARVCSRDYLRASRRTCSETLQSAAVGTRLKSGSRDPARK